MKSLLLDDKTKIVKILQAADVSRSDLARRLGVSYKTVYRWIDKGVSPHPAQAREMDRLFRELVDLNGVLYERKKALVNPLRRLKADSALRERFILEAAYHSSALSGSRMTLPEVRMVNEGAKPRNRELLEILETVNHINALRFMLESLHPGFKVGRGFILKLNEIIMYNFSNRSPGKFRRPLNEENDFHLRLNRLLRSLRSLSRDPILDISRAHVDFLALKPFMDGNARTARLIMSAQLLSVGFAPVILRIEDKDEYSSLLSGAKNGDIERLSRFICESVIRGYGFFSSGEERKE